MSSADMDGYTGLTREITGTPEQIASLHDLWKANKLAAGETMLKHGAGASYDEEVINLPPGLIVADNVRQGNKPRRLANVEGVKPILAVRVTDSGGLVHPHNAVQMSDNLFGTDGDPVNLKSQLAACSHGKLQVEAGAIANSQNKAAEGMVEVTIGISLEGNNRGAILNAAKAAVQNLGISIPGDYQQVMFVLKGCYQDCGWAAYAYVNRWDSVYQVRAFNLTVM